MVIEIGSPPSQGLVDYTNWLLQPTIAAGASLCQDPVLPKHRIPCPAHPNPFLLPLAQYGVSRAQGAGLEGIGGPKWVDIGLPANEDASDPNAQTPAMSDRTIYRLVTAVIQQKLVLTGPRYMYVVLVDKDWDVALTSGQFDTTFSCYFFKENTSSSGSAESSTFTGFHFYDLADPSQNAVPVVVEPLCSYFGDGNQTTAPNQERPLKAFAISLSHEVEEAVTDPYPNHEWFGPGGWPRDDSDRGGEVADYCENDPNFGAATLDSHWVSEIWSNATASCTPG